MSRDLREFIPIEEGKGPHVHVCGPTVLQLYPRRNARSTVAFDTIRRYFEYRGYEGPTFPTLQMWMIRSLTVPKKKALPTGSGRQVYCPAFREDDGS